MPRVLEFSSDNKTQDNFEFPKLKLDNNETARIVVLEKPIVEYVHTLRAPVLVNGRGVKQTKERKNGTTYEVYKDEFVSNPICLGDPDILDERGSDPKNCPVCKLASEGDTVQAPKRRFAMHVLQYDVDSKGKITKPFTVRARTWGFTDMVFNRIVDIASEVGDLKDHDLILGPCSDKTFQKFDITPSMKAEWSSNGEDNKARALETFKENKAPDLSRAAGSKKDLKWINDDLDKITDRWNIINGVESNSDSEFTAVRSSNVSLDAGLDDLLSSQADSGTTQNADVATAATDDEGWAKEAPKEQKSSATSSFDDLLADI